ncbi:MAG: glycosyltransferase [Thermodesulfobacteriota bacterium]
MHCPDDEIPSATVAVSVIIPFFNAEKTLASCIQSLQALQADNFEVILVNNNSTDASPSVAQTATQQDPQRFFYEEEKCQGPVFARNRGAGRARGDILAFIDADCLVRPDWLPELLRSFENARVGAVAGRISGYGGRTVYDKFHALFTFRGPQQPQVYSRFTLIRGGFPTANLAVRGKLFQRIGGFDPSLKILYAEDYDLCARIYREGFHIRYNPEAVVDHIHRNSLVSTWKQSYGFGTGHAVLLKKHFKRRLILELPRCLYETEKIPVRAWVDLASADKKLMGLLALALVWWPLVGLTPVYLIYLFREIKSRTTADGMTSGRAETWALVFLLLFKSLAMTLGRIDGALKNRVLCC